METKRIETMSKWLAMKQILRDKGYHLWTTQYSYDQPEGYRVCFRTKDKQIEVVTHDKEIAADMIRY